MSKITKSGPNIRHWVQDRMAFLALVIFLLGAGGYIATDMLFPPKSIWMHPVKEFSLLIALIGIVSFGYEVFLRELTFREYKQALEEIVNPDAVRLGIQGIYKNRSELGQATSFESLFKNVKHEIFIGGTSLLSISTSSREQLKEKILSGVNVKLLLMDPNSPVVELITKQGGGKSTFLNEIKTSLLLLQKLQDEIESSGSHSRKGSLIVHTYDSIPSHSFISVDPDDPSGLIIADLGPYLGRTTPRPSMSVVKKKKGMYDYWAGMNDLMWEKSHPVDLKSGDPLLAKTRTLVFTSGPEETQYYDAQSGDWRNASICLMDDDWRSMKGSQWVWVRKEPTLEEARTGSQNRFRLEFTLPVTKSDDILKGELFLRSDDACRITVNDVSLKHEYNGAGYPDPFLIKIDKYLAPGENTLAFELSQFAQPDAQSPEDNRTGLIYRLHLEYRV